MIILRQLPSGHLSAWHNGELLGAALTDTWFGEIKLRFPVGQFELGPKVSPGELTDREALKATLTYADDLAESSGADGGLAAARHGQPKRARNQDEFWPS